MNKKPRKHIGFKRSAITEANKNSGIPNHLIEKLHEKKHREEKGLFLAEGEKNILELLESDFEIYLLVLSHSFFKKYQSKIENTKAPYSICDEGEIKKLSTLEFNPTCLAIVKQKKVVIRTKEQIKEKAAQSDIILVLDGVRDPGNLGTMIRIADWYGISEIIASEDTTDFYNPKTISATMGSFTRVTVTYTNLFDYLKKTHLPIIGAYMQGSSVHSYDFPTKGILVIGNESNGVSHRIAHLIQERLTIPAYGGAESLNAAISSGIILDNWRRLTN